jgi:hypothetical protein
MIVYMKYNDSEENIIKLSNDHDIKKWCARFNCTQQQLERAVSTVGTSARAVKLYLREKGLRKPKMTVTYRKASAVIVQLSTPATA